MYISPTISDIKALSAKKAEYENVLSKAKEISAQRDTILAEYNNIPEAQISKLNKIIPDSYDSVTFANDINNLALKNGLTIKSLKDSLTAPSDRNVVVVDSGTPSLFQTNRVTIVLSGGYDQFTSFLSNLETSLHLTDVSSLSVRAVQDAKSSVNSFEFKLEVLVYSLK